MTRGLVALAVLVALAARLFWLVVIGPAFGADFYQFWAVARAEAEGGLANPYSDEARDELAEAGRRKAAQSPSSLRLAQAVQYRSHVETFSTPFLYLFAGAFSSADYEASLQRFGLLRFACLLAGVTALCRLAGCDLGLTGLWLLALIWFSEPVRWDARVGNVNALQLALLAGYLGLSRATSAGRQVAAGTALGLLVAFKPTLGLVALFLALDWALQRDWRRLALQSGSALATALVAVLASSLYFGSGRVWLDWLAALPELERVANVSVANGNYSLARLAAELGAGVPSAAIVAALTLALAACAWLGTRSSAPAERNVRDLLLVGLACAAAVIGEPLSWQHYFVLLTPLAIVLFRRFRSTGEGVAVGVASLLVLGVPLRALGADTSPWHLQAATYLTGALVLFALGLAELARARAPG